MKATGGSEEVLEKPTRPQITLGEKEMRIDQVGKSVDRHPLPNILEGCRSRT